MGRASMRPPERTSDRASDEDAGQSPVVTGSSTRDTSARETADRPERQGDAHRTANRRRGAERQRAADRAPVRERRSETVAGLAGTARPDRAPDSALPIPRGWAMPPQPNASVPATGTLAAPAPAASGTLSGLAARPASGTEWTQILDRIRATLEERLPDTPGRERLGIQDIARAANLTVQQVRLMERQGLVRPAFEVSGRKRNRRYTRQEALLILAAAQLMHRHGIRPAQAATYVLARGLGGNDDTASAAVADRADRETVAGTPDRAAISAAYPAALGPAALGLAARDRAAFGLDAGLVGSAAAAPGAGILAAAASRLREIIAARLVLIAVSGLLGGRALPAQSIVRARLAWDPAPDAGERDPEDATAARALSEPATPERVAPERVAPGPSAQRPPLDMRVVPVASPHDDQPGGSAVASSFWAFVAAGGEVFYLPPSSRLLHQPREWYALQPPVAGPLGTAAADRPAIEVVVGVPRGDDTGPVPARLAPERYLLPAETAAVSATLLWTVLAAIPEVIHRALVQAEAGEIRVDRLAIEGGLIRVVLWLYAQVLARVCPGIEQCDILAPHADPGGGAPVLYLTASSDPHEQGQPPRAIIHSGQLLSGFAYSFGQPAYVEDVNASHGVLVSYRTLERARAAAAIPAIFERRPRACVYLFSRTSPVHFAPALRRALEVAANEVAEVLRWKTLALDLNHEGILNITRPYAPEPAAVLRALIARWLREIARAAHPAGSWTALARSAPGMAALAPALGLGAHAPTALDDRRLVMVVVGAEPGSRFRGQGEILGWLDEAARTAAERLAQALDEGVLGGAMGGPRPRAEDEPPGGRPADDEDDAGDEAGAEADDQFAPSTAARVFAWQAARRDAEAGPVTAYVVLAGLNLTRPHVERLKELIRQRGLNGAVEVRTEGGEPVGKLNAWVLHTKRSIAERMILARAASAPSPQAAARRVEQSLADEITNCAHVLPYVHEFHTEAFYRGNLERAIVILKRALPLAPDDMFILRHLLDLYVRAGRLDEALALASAAPAGGDVPPVKWHTTLARAYQIRGDYAAAIWALRQAMRADPANPMPYRLAGQTFLAAADGYAARATAGDHRRAARALEASARCLRRAIVRERIEAGADAPRAEGRIVDTTLLLGDALGRQGHLDALLPLYEDLMAEFPHTAKDHVLFHDRLLAARRQRWHAHGRA